MQSGTSKAHPVLYMLTFIGFSGIVTLAAFCAKIGGAQEQLTAVVSTQANESKTLADLARMEAVDQYHLSDLDQKVNKLQEKR